MGRFLLALFLLGVSYSPANAADEFKVNNPDIKKYEFARSYITALSYFKFIDDRWHKNAPKKIHGGDDDKVIKLTIDYLTKDNAQLRVIKNYMMPYLSSKNALMRKVADMVITACDEEIAINDQNKIAWQQWDYLKKAGKATAANQEVFIKSHREYGFRLKEADKNIIQASILMTKVLVSDKNKDDTGSLLAITAQEREKLLEKLDSFGKDVLDWGLKPGQRTLDASIAVIREVLEDSVWISLDEK